MTSNTRYRAAVIMTAALALPGAALTAVAAQANTHHAHHVHANKATAGSLSATGGSVAEAFKAAVAGLVSAGTLDRHQAEAINGQVDSGSVDPKQLVSSGALSETQMRAVAAATQGLK
jgi:hypothetical protein